MKRRILSILTALVLCLGLLPETALAADTNPVLDISNGSIWIADGQYAQAKTVTTPSAWTDYTGEITITGTSASWYSVDVTSGTHTIRLKDAAIKPQANQDDMRDGTPALSISQSTVNLILEGTSTLKGSGSYALETFGKDCVNLSGSSLSITGGGTLNVQGGDSLKQAEASSPIGGNGFYLSGSTLRVSDGAVLNVTGGNMSLKNNWWGGGIYANNSSIELSGGALSSKGVEGFDLRSSRLSQSGGTLSVEGRRGIDSEENQKFQAEISSGSANIHSYIYSALRCGSLTVSGGEVTLRTDSSLGAVESTASVTVSPASGYAGILKNGDGPDSAVRTPIPEEKTLSSIQEKYVNLTFSNETHDLTVQDGGAGSSGSGSYLLGQKVSIRAGTVSDKNFKWWEKVSGDGVFANAEAADTTFTMGWEDAEIRPVFVTGKVVGDFVVSTEAESGYTYESGVLTISGNGTYAISMKEPGTATGNRIRLNGGSPTVILDGVQINSVEPAIALEPSSTTNATLMLSGVNKLSATGSNAGIAVWTSNPTYYSVSLTITSLAGDGSSEGRLETTGCSGIGAYGSQDSGAITINGGTIIATGNRNGSYVGYGIGSKGSNPVTINGGDVTATGEQGFSNNLILNNNPSIQVNGDFKNGVSGGESQVRVYYDSQGGSTVKSVAVIPQDGKVLTSEALQLSAQVEGGGNADKTVAWSVTGALSEGTSIDENGLLTVAAGEKAAALTVTALNSYSGLSDSATVTVTKKLLLPAPTGLQLSLPDKASRNSLDAAASWDAVDEAASYLVQLYKNGTAEGGEISVTGTSHHFSIRSQGKYTFKVRAVRSDGAEGQEAESEAKQIYLVSFTPDNKLDPSLSQLSAAGGKLERPEDPVKAGYTFGGWKKGLFSSNLWDFQNDTVKNTATLFALWKKNYTVTVQTDGNGSASASPNSAAEGTAITLTAAANSGYHFKEWEVVSGGVSISNDSFTMPERDVTVKAVFEQDDAPPEPETYTITVQTEGDGTASAAPASATEGTAITLTATANSGYHFKEWEVVSGSVTISNDSFIMPAGNVTVKAVFEQDAPETYIVTVQTEGSGRASASPASAAAGTTISLTATADSGYHFKEWEVVSGGVTISNGSFIMPAGNVTVKAVFEQDAPETYTVTVQTEGSGRASASPASATAGTTISLTATADSGYHFKEWQVVSGGVTISNDSFTMPEGNVTVKAVFEQDAPPEHVHKWDSAWNRDGNHHWHECLADGCDIASNSGKDGYGAHIYDDEQDTDCNVCGHIRTVTPPGPEHVHKWAAVWSGDGNHHWHECFADGCDITSDSGKDGYAAHVYDNEQDTDCNVCGHVREVTPPEQPDDETTKIEIAEGIVEVPPALAELKHLNTPEKIAQAMRAAITQTGVPARNTAVYDVTLMISTDGGATWTTATAANFPANGLTVTLPYPAGTNSSYTFTVVHMFTTSDFNKTPGDTETPRVTNTASGLQFTVTGLSPISVGWVQPSTPTTPTGPTGGGGGGGGGSSSAYAVTVERAEHGKVTSNRTNASSGSTVTLTVMPDTGYVLDTLTVTDSRGSEIKLTAQGGGKYTFTMPGRAVTVKAAFAPLPDDTEKPCDGGVDCPSHGFTDLGTVGTWYHEAVDYVLRNNLMGGYGNGLFGPNDTLTRAQFAQILYNKEGRPAVTGGGIFTDVAPSAWCAPAITWAAERGIVGGYGNGMFGPNDNITREQLAVMLWRYAGSPAATDKELHFNDAGKASGYALDALRWAVENGVMSGKGGGILDPKGLATRAQTAQMLKNFLGK